MRSSRRPGQPKAATTNLVRDYQALEREFITGTMSLRELCRRHGVTAHSAVMVHARQGNWAEKRRAYRERATSTYIQRHADRAAAREAQVRDHAIEAIDEAITRFRADLRATERKLIGGEWVEVPALRITLRDLALLIDRLQILFGRPAMISEGRGFAATFTSDALPVEALRGDRRADPWADGHPCTGGVAPAPTPPSPGRLGIRSTRIWSRFPA